MPFTCIHCSLRPIEATASNEDGAHVDVSASEFWESKHQKPFPMSKLLLCTFLSWYPSIHLHIIDILNVKNRQWKYEIGIGSFTPIVFSTLRDGMGHPATVFYRRLAFLASLQKELFIIIL